MEYALPITMELNLYNHYLYLIDKMEHAKISLILTGNRPSFDYFELMQHACPVAIYMTRWTEKHIHIQYIRKIEG